MRWGRRAEGETVPVGRTPTLSGLTGADAGHVSHEGASSVVDGSADRAFSISNADELCRVLCCKALAATTVPLAAAENVIGAELTVWSWDASLLVISERFLDAR